MLKGLPQLTHYTQECFSLDDKTAIAEFGAIAKLGSLKELTITYWHGNLTPFAKIRNIKLKLSISSLFRKIDRKLIDVLKTLPLAELKFENNRNFSDEELALLEELEIYTLQNSVWV